VVICKVCDNKQLCKDCDVKWHNHPKRQNHKLEYIHPALDDGRQPSCSSEQSKMSDPRMQGIYIYILSITFKIVCFEEEVKLLQ
jgi:hypothetical protein